MLTIRLSQVGKKNKKTFRLIISEKSRDTFGRALEILGSYNPHDKKLVVKADRIKYWLSQGSGMSATVNNLLVANKIIEGEKVRASRLNQKKNKNKAEEKTEEKVKADAPKEEKKIEETKAEEPKVEKEKVEEKVEEKTEEKAEKKTEDK